MNIKKITTLLYSDLRIEFKSGYALGGILLFVVSTIFLMYYNMQQQGGTEDITHKVWSSLFWLVVLFSVVNAVTKTMLHTSKGKMFYYYFLVDARSFIFSKIIFNSLLVLLLSLLSSILFFIYIGNPVKHFGLFFGTIILGATSFSTLFTMMAGVASKAEQHGVLLSILAFPLAIPLITFLSKISKEAFIIQTSENLILNLCILIAFNVVLIALAYILYPIVWKE